jgi:pimeloyl-ACP methyl ester carboxylesterase
VEQNSDASSFLHDRLDVQKFGLVGHGRGGAAALIAAAQPASLGRVKAAVGLGPHVLRLPSDSFGEFVTYSPNATTGYWPPTLVVTGTQDAFASAYDSRIVYFDHAPKPRGTVEVAGHCNMSYADSVPAAVAATSDYDPSTCETPASQQQVARTYVIPWLLFHLRGDTRVKDYVDGTYAAEQINVPEETFE